MRRQRFEAAEAALFERVVPRLLTPIVVGSVLATIASAVYHAVAGHHG